TAEDEPALARPDVLLAGAGQDVAGVGAVGRADAPDLLDPVAVPAGAAAPGVAPLELGAEVDRRPDQVNPGDADVVDALDVLVLAGLDADEVPVVGHLPAAALAEVEDELRGQFQFAVGGHGPAGGCLAAQDDAGGEEQPDAARRGGEVV